MNTQVKKNRDMIDFLLENMDCFFQSTPSEEATPFPLEHKIKNSPLYSRLKTLWTMEKPGKFSPYWLKQVSNANEVYQQKKDLFFQSVYFQSTQGAGFRERILWSMAGLERLQNNGPIYGETFLSLKSASKQMSALCVDCSEVSENTSSLQKTYLARILCYLGFYAEAKLLVPIPWAKKQWSEEDSLLVYTNLFLQYIAGGSKKFLDECHAAFLRMPDSDKMLRTKLTLAIMCGGFCGKIKDIKRVKLWREDGTRILHKIKACSQFDPEEILLLTSRWWRFACFLPFLVKDKKQLIQESNLYQSLAREAGCKNLRTKENMYAALETKARIEQFGGNLDAAIESLHELASNVDPFDSKVWLNIGDLYEKKGDFDKAIENFNKAIECGPPFRELSCFRLGLVLTRLKRFDEALQAQLASIEAYPFGVAPLQHIAGLLLELGDKAGCFQVCSILQKILLLKKPAQAANVQTFLEKIRSLSVKVNNAA